MEPQEIARIVAGSIGRELTQYPERWCQGSAKAVRDPVTGKMETPFARCLLDHITWRAAVFGEWAYATALPFQARAGTWVQTWNDAPGRTVREVIDLCSAVADG